MLPYERVENVIKLCSEKGTPALIPFLTAGYPNPSKFIDTLVEVCSLGDVVEIGVPFSDPMADGMTIQRSSFSAIEKGVTLAWIFDQLEGYDGKLGAPLVMMSYLNPLLAFGYEELSLRAKQLGICAFIVPDLPLEESEEIRSCLEENGVGLIQLVTPATPDNRIKMLSEVSKGFLYAVTITGITGGKSGLPEDLTKYLDKVSSIASLPVCAGFGIRTKEDVIAVGNHAAGAIVGSALVEILEQGEDPSTFLSSLK